MPHVVIIGAGFGGLTAARRLAGQAVHVTLIDRSNHHLFQPLLYQVATAGLSPANIAVPIRSIVRHARNIEVLMEEVVGIDVAARQVLVGRASEPAAPTPQVVPYDLLIVATGARHSYFGKDEWAKFAPGLKSLRDATLIRQRILYSFERAEKQTDPVQRQAELTFAIVGGGPTGVELAGSIAELAHKALERDFRHIDPDQTRIVLLEAGERVLAGFDPSLSAGAARKLAELGVEVRCGSRVQAIDENGLEVSQPAGAGVAMPSQVGGERIPAKTVLWAAGVQASAAGKWLGCTLDRAGRATVEPDLSVPGHPEIFVIGDTALVMGKEGKPLPGVAPVAMQQGLYVADKILRKIRGRPDRENQKAFRYLDKGNLATVGRFYAVAEVGRWKLRGAIAWVAWIFVHIYYLIGFRARVMALLEWAWAYLTFQRGARLITVDSPKEL
jgi:NADH dehydrogenase